MARHHHRAGTAACRAKDRQVVDGRLAIVRVAWRDGDQEAGGEARRLAYALDPELTRRASKGDKDRPYVCAAPDTMLPERVATGARGRGSSAAHDASGPVRRRGDERAWADMATLVEARHRADGGV